MTRKDLRAAWFLGVTNLVRSLRTPMLVAASLLQPVIWLVLFSEVFSGLANTSQFRSLGYRSYVAFFAPGMIVLSVMFTALQSGVATIADIDAGVMDKLLISPISRSSILAARVAADAVKMIAQGAIVLGVGIAMGARVRTGVTGALGLLALAALFGIVWAALSNLIALRTRNAEATMVAGLFLTLPALFLTPAFFPRPYLPAWLQAVTSGNPAAYVIEAGQRLISTGNSWDQDGRTLAALAITGLVVVPATLASFRAVTR